MLMVQFRLYTCGNAKTRRAGGTTRYKQRQGKETPVVPYINRQLGIIWASLIDAIWDTVQLLDEIERTHGHKLLPGPLPFLDGPLAQFVVPDPLGALAKFLGQRFLGNALDAPAI